MTENVSAEQLQLFIERVETLNESIKGLQDDRKDTFAEMRSQGFDVPTVKSIIKLRALEKHQRDEMDALLETYRNALGLH